MAALRSSEVGVCVDAPAGLFDFYLVMRSSNKLENEQQSVKLHVEILVIITLLVNLSKMISL